MRRTQRKALAGYARAVGTKGSGSVVTIRQGLSHQNSSPGALGSYQHESFTTRNVVQGVAKGRPEWPITSRVTRTFKNGWSRKRWLPTWERETTRNLSVWLGCLTLTSALRHAFPN